MSDFVFILNAVLPLFLMILAGVLIRNLLHYGDAQAQTVNRVVYYVFLPCMLFRNALTSDFSGMPSVWLYVYGAFGLVVTGLICVWAAAKGIPDKKQAGAFAHCAIRTNSALFGIPLAVRYLGEAESFPAVLMVTVLLPVLNVYGIATLSYFSGKKNENVFVRVVKGLVKSPLIISLALGFLLKALRIQIPDFLDDTVKTLGSAASPAAMVAIGMGFSMKGIRKNLGLVSAASAVKTVVQPLILTLAAILIGFRGMELLVIFLSFSVPSAANSAVICGAMDSDSELAGEIVIGSTLFSMFTIVCGLTVLKSLGLI